MIDPIATVQSIYSIYTTIKQLVDTAQTNRESFQFLLLRCDAVLAPVNSLKSDTIKLSGKAETLQNLQACFKRIEEFMKLARFQKKKGFRERLNELMFAEDDAATFQELSGTLSVLLGDLTAVVAINMQQDQCVFRDETNKNFQMILDLLGKNAVSPAGWKPVVQLSVEKAEKIENIISNNFDDSAGKVVSTAVKTEVRVIQLTPINQRHLVLVETSNYIIGQGSFGTVYSAKYNSKPVAVKVFPNLGRVDAHLMKAIKKEALIMQFVDHPNIIGFEAASLDKGQLITELANCALQDVLHSGHTITSASLSPARLSVSWKLSIATDVAKALRYIHAHNIVHRDIKPANILLLVEGSRTVAKLADFGLSQAVDIAASTIAMTKSVRPVGTVKYMAPELFETTPPSYTSASDMFAFGSLVVELMTGERPWVGLQDHMVSHRLINKCERPSRDNWKVGSDKQETDLYALVGCATSGCLSQQPHNRPSAEDVCEKVSVFVYKPSIEFVTKKAAKSCGSTVASVEPTTSPASPVEISSVSIEDEDIIRDYHTIKTCILMHRSVKKELDEHSYGPSVFTYRDEYGWTLNHWLRWVKTDNDVKFFEPHPIGVRQSAPRCRCMLGYTLCYGPRYVIEFAWNIFTDNGTLTMNSSCCDWTGRTLSVLPFLPCACIIFPCVECICERGCMWKSCCM